jgi:hypothetical protein
LLDGEAVVNGILDAILQAPRLWGGGLSRSGSRQAGRQGDGDDIISHISLNYIIQVSGFMFHPIVPTTG